jgi:hypothetical protein
MNKDDKLNPTHNPQASWLFISVFGVMALGIIAIMVAPQFAERGERERASWPETNGKPTATRVIAEGPTERFPITMHVGQCSVDYTVGGKHYSLWAASGYLDPDLKWMADRMRECPVSHFVVHYNPANPAEAFAERTDEP